MGLIDISFSPEANCKALLGVRRASNNEIPISAGRSNSVFLDFIKPPDPLTVQEEITFYDTIRTDNYLFFFIMFEIKRSSP